MPELFHRRLERSTIGFVLAIIAAASVGGIVEIAPLFTIDETVEEAPDMRLYTPLELAGRNIYVREGCYNCHSQMIRPLRDEIERYGHYSLAAESMYDRPFQWGSKRTGPDLARVGGKYSDEWHRDHLNRPNSVVPGTVMPAYPWLARTELDFRHIASDLAVQSKLGVPYSQDMIQKAAEDLKIQATADHPDVAELEKRYPKAQSRDYDGDPRRITEADALIAYLQMLGTQVDFKLYDNKANIR